jgi:hypothetical protein
MDQWPAALCPIRKYSNEVQFAVLTFYEIDVGTYALVLCHAPTAASLIVAHLA